MSRSRRPVLIAALCLAVVLGVVVAVIAYQRSNGPDDRLRQAVALAPASAERLSWTDWAGVRASLDMSLTAESPERDVERLLDKGYDADLTSTSALLESSAALHTEYGISPATLEWELFSQGTDGALLLLGLPDSLDLDTLRGNLTDLGYVEPKETDGVWSIDVDQLSLVGVTPEFNAIRIDEESGVLAASDRSAFLEEWPSSARGSDAVTDDSGVADALGGLAAGGTALTASIYTGDYACAELSMAHAGAPEQAEADTLLARAGEVNPLTGFAIGEYDDRSVRVAMAVETEDEARTNADTRAALATGPAPGQGGTFAERFTLDEAAAEDRVVTLDLTPTRGSFVVSDLNHGPVLFATC